LSASGASVSFVAGPSSSATTTASLSPERAVRRSEPANRGRSPWPLERPTVCAGSFGNQLRDRRGMAPKQVCRAARHQL
jgi:hypothetical protein